MMIGLNFDQPLQLSNNFAKVSVRNALSIKFKITIINEQLKKK